MSRTARKTVSADAPCEQGLIASRAFREIHPIKAALRWGLLVVLAACAELGAQTVYWDNGNGNSAWATAMNWSNNAVPTSTTAVTFDATYVTTNQTIDLASSNRPVGSVSFTSALNYTFNNTSTNRHLDLYGSGTNFTQNGSGAVVINAPVWLSVGFVTAGSGTGNVTINGVISDGGGTDILQKGGSFTLILNGTNTQDGTVLNAGTIEFGNNSAAGSGGLTLNSGTIRAGGAARTLSNAVTVGGDFTVSGSNALTLSGAMNLGGANRTVTTSNTAATTFSGIISNGSLTKAGAGTLVLSGANTYTGATTISAGTLQLAGQNDRLANSTAVTVASGATFDLNNFSETVGSVGGAGNILLGTGTLTVGGNSVTNFSGVISESGSVVLGGTGALTLSGANTYTGGTRVDSGTLDIGNNAALGTGTLTLNGGTIDAAGSARTISNAVSLAASSTIAGTNDLTVSGALTNTMAGNPTLTVTNTGTTTLGAIHLSNSTTNRTFTLSNSGAVTVAGVIDNGSSAASSLTKSGSGTLTLSGANTYGGATRITGGVLSIANFASGSTTSAIGNSGSAATNLVLNGGALRYTGTATTTNRLFSVGTSGGTIESAGGVLTLSGAGAIGFDNQTGNRTFTLAGAGDGVLTPVLGNNGGISSLAKTGAGTWTLAGDNTYTGTTTIGGGTLKVGAGGTTGAIGTGTVTNNGALVLNRSDTALAVTANISGMGSITQAGTGTSTLSGTNSYTGGTTISGGTLKLTGAAAMGGSGSAVNLGGGNLQLATDTGVNAYNTTVSANSGIQVNRATTAGTGTYNLGTLAIGAHTLTVTPGTNLATNGAYTLGFGPTTLTGNATLDVSNNGTGIGTVTLGAVSETGGPRSLTKSGSGTVVFQGSNSYSGTTTVGGGALIVNPGAQLAGATSGLVMSGGRLTLNNAAQQLSTLTGTGGTIELATGNSLTINETGNSTYAGSFSATSSTSKVEMNGTGTLTLSGDNSAFAGQINVLQGTVIASSANALGNSTTATAVSSGAALRLSGGITTNGGNLTLTGTGVANGGALNSQTGTNTLGGSITVSGSATITAAAGTLNLGTTSPVFNPSGHTQPSESGNITIGGATLTFKGAGNIVVNDRIRDFAGQKAGTSFQNATTLNYAPETTNPGSVVVDMATSAANVHYLANANSYTGTTFVKNGTLIVDTITNSNTAPHDPNTDSFHGINGAVEIGNGSVGATLQLGTTPAGAANEVLSLNSTIKLYQDGTFNVNSQSQSIGGLTFSGGGTVQLGNTGHLYLNGDVVVNPNAGQTALINTGSQGVLDLTLHRAAGIDSGDVTRTFTVAHGTGNTSDLTINAIIQGNVSAGNFANLTKAGAGMMTLMSTNTYNGTTTVSDGILNIRRASDTNGNSGLGSAASGTVVNNGATLQLQNLAGGAVAGQISGEALTISGSGYGGQGALENVAGANIWTGGITLGSANARIQADSGSTLLIKTGGISGTAGSSLEAGGAGNTTIASSIGSGVGGITKNGTGTLTLSGGNSFSGPVRVDAGALSVQNNTALGSGNTTTVASGASMAFDSTANGNLLVSSGIVNLNGDGGPGNASGPGALRNTAGTNQFYGSVNLQSSSSITANAGTSLTLGGSVTNTTASTLTIGSTTGGYNGSITIAGAMNSGTGALNLVKRGTLGGSDGMLTISGGGRIGTVNLLEGGITVQNNTLNTGAFASSASTSLTIASGGVVNATYSGGMTFFSGTIASPGSNGQSGTFSAQSTAGSNSTLVFGSSFNAGGLTLSLGGATKGGTDLSNYLHVDLGGTQITVGTLHITGDTILDFGSSGSTILSSGSLIIDPGVNIRVTNWVTAANATMSTIWYATGTVNNIALGSTNQTPSSNSGLGQITFTNPSGTYYGNTPTWVADTSSGWYSHEIRPTPEPATYGAVLLGGCLGLFGWRRHRRRKVQTSR